ncbi:reverse transcriptase domain-containing protein [Tanacetum coccineum]
MEPSNSTLPKESATCVPTYHCRQDKIRNEEGTDIKEMDKRKDKTRQNQARDWKERKITSLTVLSDFIGEESSILPIARVALLIHSTHRFYTQPLISHPLLLTRYESHILLGRNNDELNSLPLTHGVRVYTEQQHALGDPKGKEYTYALRFGFETKNNKAEYEALLAELRISQDMEIVCLAIFADSQLLVNQIKVLVKVLSKRSIEEKEILQVETKEEESWMTPIHEYLVSGLLTEDPKESRKIRVKAPQYKLIRGRLYQRSFYTPWLRCVASPQTDDIVKEIHEGSCGFNAEPRSMVVRITKQGYYWSSMYRDTAKVIKDYKKCKEQSAIRKAVENGAITTGNGWSFSH